MKPKTYTQYCTDAKRFLPKGCRFLEIGEPIPAGTRFIDEDGEIRSNPCGAAKLAAIHCPHFVNVERRSVSDEILAAFQLEIKLARESEKAFAKAKNYIMAAKYSVRADILDEACGIAMRAVKP